MNPLRESELPSTRQKILRGRLAGTLAAGGIGLALLVALAGFAPAAGAAADADWSQEERSIITSMSLSKLPAPPADPSNAVADKPEAALLGKRVFADVRFSRNGAVSCASCHAPDRQFQDDRPVGQGLGLGKRRTMPVAASAFSPFLFWDGRKDSQWAQALGPLEDGAEHGGNRVRYAQVIRTVYLHEYESLFGAMPDLQGLPTDASPLGTQDEQRAWSGMTDGQRDAVNRIFANLGKAIAAYERTVTYGESRFDHYVDAVRNGDRAGEQVLSSQEVKGLHLFIGKGQCATCHSGPLLTDQAFHNTGIVPRDMAHLDHGRAPATARVQSDEFNCLGRYSDATAQACQELSFLVTDDPRMEGAFKTPSLRNVALRAPYMHSGQMATLDDVVAHYVRAPAAAVGQSELSQRGTSHSGRMPIQMTDDEMQDVVAFLHALSGPIVERTSR